MSTTYRRGRRGRYSAPKRNRLNTATAGVIGVLTAFFVIGACTDDPTEPQETSSDIPVPTEINVGREGRTVEILEDGHDGNDDGRKVMTQTDFPCNEDEVLAYDPSFGPDHVGCLHREDLD